MGKKKKNMRVSRTGLKKKEKQFDNVVEAEELIIAKKKEILTIKPSYHSRI